MDRSHFEKEYRVRYFEVDYQLKMLPTSLMNYFTDIATLHSEKCGAGLEFLKEHNLAWIVYRYDIKIHKPVYFNEKIKVSTTACSFHRFNAYRTFYVDNESGERVAEANALFMLIDYNKRRLTRIPEAFYEAYGASSGQNTPLDFNKPEALKELSYQESFKVRYTDIDTNTHVNNVKYLDWLIESIPLEYIRSSYLSQIRIDYLKESVYGDIITSKVEIKEEDNGIRMLHSIENQKGQQITMAETLWIKGNN